MMAFVVPTDHSSTILVFRPAIYTNPSPYIAPATNGHVEHPNWHSMWEENATLWERMFQTYKYEYEEQIKRKINKHISTGDVWYFRNVLNVWQVIRCCYNLSVWKWIVCFYFLNVYIYIHIEKFRYWILILKQYTRGILENIWVPVAPILFSSIADKLKMFAYKYLHCLAWCDYNTTILFSIIFLIKIFVHIHI